MLTAADLAWVGHTRSRAAAFAAARGVVPVLATDNVSAFVDRARASLSLPAQERAVRERMRINAQTSAVPWAETCELDDLDASNRAFLLKALRASPSTAVLRPRERGAKSARCALRHDNWVRVSATALIRSNFLDTVVGLATIVYISLLTYLPTGSNADSTPLARGLLVAAPYLASLYSLDMLIRVIALGVCGPFGYERSELVAIDVVVVTAGWLAFVLPPSNFFARLTALRLLRIVPLVPRVLPLKTIRLIFSALSNSASSLFYTFVLLVISNFTWSLVALFLWRGTLQGQCGWTDAGGFQQLQTAQLGGAFLSSTAGAGLSSPNPANGSLFWSSVPTTCPLNCDPYPDGGCILSYGVACGSAVVPFLWPDGVVNATRRALTCERGLNPDNGQTSFDNILHALVQSTSSVMTTEGWSDIFYDVAHAWAASEEYLVWIVFFIFVVNIVITSYALYELAAAMLISSLIDAEARDEGRDALLLRSVQARMARERAQDHSDDVVDSNAVDQVSEGAGIFERRRRLDSLVDYGEVKETLHVITKVLTSSEFESTPLKRPARVRWTEVAARTAARVSDWYGRAVPGLPDRVRQRLSNVTESTVFSRIVLALILANAVVLGFESEGMSPTLASALNILNFVFTGLFTVEALLQLAVHGVRGYSQRFLGDGLVVIAGLAEITAQAFAPGLRLTYALRSVRALRLFRLGKFWPKGNALIVRLVSVLPAAASALALLFFCLFFFALLGKGLFSNSYDLFNSVPGGAPFLNYANLVMGFLATFEAVDNENVNFLIKQHQVVFGWQSTVFFLAIIVVGNLIFLNLFLAIVFNGIEEVDESPGADPSVEAFGGGLQHLFRVCRRRAGAAAAVTSGGSSTNDSLVTVANPMQSPALPSPTMNTAVPRAQSRRRRSSVNPFFNRPADAANPDEMRLEVHLRKDGVADRVLVMMPIAVTTPPSVGGQQAASSSAEPPAEVKSIEVRSSGVLRVLTPDLESSNSVWSLGASLLSSLWLRVTKQRANLASHAERSFATKNAVRGAVADALPTSAVERFRNLLRKSLTSYFFNAISLSVILWSCVNLVIDDPKLALCEKSQPLTALSLNVDRSSLMCTTATYLSFSDEIIAWFFFLELVLNALAYGLIDTEASVLRNAWSRLDIIVVFVSLLGVYGADAAASAGIPISSLRSLRAGRVLRVFRLAHMIPPLRLVVTSLFGSLPDMLPPLFVVCIFVYTFAVIGVQMFRGTLGACNDGVTSTQDACTGYFYVAGDSCTMLPTNIAEVLCRGSTNGTLTAAGLVTSATLRDLANVGALGLVNVNSDTYTARVKRVWSAAPESFDWIGNALLTVYELTSGENWPNIMQNMMTALSTAEGKGADVSNSAAALGAATYIVLSQIILNQVLIELVASVVIDMYARKRLAENGLALLTGRQAVQLTSIYHALLRQPLVKHVPPHFTTPAGVWRSVQALVDWVNCVRAKIFVVTESVYFERSVLLLVTANLASVSAEQAFATQGFIDVMAIINVVFTWIFIGEAVLKLAGLGFSQYLWRKAGPRGVLNRIDVIVSLSSLFSLIFSPTSVWGSGLRMLRALRVVRFFTIPGLRLLIETLTRCFMAILYVVAVLALDLFVFSCIAVDLFSGVRFGSLGYLHGGYPGAPNFDSFGSTFITLFRCSTGENFNGIMRELMAASPGSASCVTAAPVANCISPGYVAAFFVVFYSVTAFVIGSIIVAVVVEAFIQVTASSEDRESGLVRLMPSAVDEYMVQWTELDPEAKNLLDFERLAALVLRLKRPLGLADSEHLQSLNSGLDLSQRRDAEILQMRARHHASKVLGEHLHICALKIGGKNFYNCHQVLLALLVRAWEKNDAERARALRRQTKQPKFVAITLWHDELEDLRSNNEPFSSFFQAARAKQAILRWILRRKRRRLLRASAMMSSRNLLAPRQYVPSARVAALSLGRVDVAAEERAPLVGGDGGGGGADVFHREVDDSDGASYYVNQRTGESVWVLPQGALLTPESQAAFP